MYFTRSFLLFCTLLLWAIEKLMFIKKGSILLYSVIYILRPNIFQVDLWPLKGWHKTSNNYHELLYYWALSIPITFKMLVTFFNSNQYYNPQIKIDLQVSLKLITNKNK